MGYPFVRNTLENSESAVILLTYREVDNINT